MAQARTFHELGSMEIKKGVTYDPSIIKSFAPNADIVKLSRGNLQYQRQRDRNGETVTPEKWLSTGLRGIKTTISNTAITYDSNYPNVPSLWEVGEERIMTTETRITPIEDGGIVTYGTMVVVA